MFILLDMCFFTLMFVEKKLHLNGNIHSNHIQIYMFDFKTQFAYCVREIEIISHTKLHFRSALNTDVV